MRKLFLLALGIQSLFCVGCADAQSLELQTPNFEIPKQTLIPFMEGYSLPFGWMDSFFKVKVLTYGENIYLYPTQNYRDLVGKNYGTAYLSCHYGDNWAWAVDDFDAYSYVYGKWGKFHDKPDEFVFAITVNNNDINKMRRDCKRSLESYDVKISNSNQISFGVNHSYVWGTRITQYDLVFYTAPDLNDLSHLIVNQ